MTASTNDVHNADNRRDELAAGLKETRALIETLAQEAGRTDVPELLPVTKFHPAADIALLGELGITDVAENREQEARAKAEELPDMRFHMIGRSEERRVGKECR